MLSTKIPRDLKLLKQLESFQLNNQLLEISVLHFIYIHFNKIFHTYMPYILYRLYKLIYLLILFLLFY